MIFICYKKHLQIQISASTSSLCIIMEELDDFNILIFLSCLKTNKEPFFSFP